ncbi:MAG TPA: DnaJ domain-containing protein [Kofleriaceae bacterium]|nr:DnaJ domain-containing protein [Kofleriaceae bacterium]
MAVLARGSISDRPWGMTLGALGLRGLSGQLTVTAGDGKAYRIAFSEGIVVGAESPLASDAAVRLALTSNLITSSQVGDITRRMAAAPERDEVDLLAELARLQPDQGIRLRRRLVAQRAARTFSVEQGSFVVEDAIMMSLVPGGELDIRTVVFLGAKANLSEDRLSTELDQLGTWFQLKPEAHDDIPQFGFSQQDRAVLPMLVEGAYVHEMISAHPDLGDHGVRAIVYSLASCGGCEIGAAPRRPPTTPPPTRTVAPSAAPPSRTMTASTAPASRTTPASTAPPIAAARTPTGTGIPRPVDRTGSSGAARAAAAGSGGTARPSGSHTVQTPTESGSFTVPRTTSPSSPPGNAGASGSFAVPRTTSPSSPPSNAGASGSFRVQSPSSSPPVGRSPSRPSVPPPVGRSPSRPSVPPPVVQKRARRDSTAATEIEQLLSIKLPLLEQGVDHFTLLGLTAQASPGDVRSAYFTLARKLHPDRLAAIGVDDSDRAAQRLMAQVNLAFAVLNDPKKRDDYASIVRRGGESVVKAEEAKADEMAMRIMRAEEAFKQGEMALRREQLNQAIEHFQMAVELQPREGEYQALLAWAKFAAAPDKNVIAGATRTALERASELNDQSPTSYFYLGRVERMLGREREALRHFQTVLAIKPNHSEAQSEARILQQRLNKR